MEKLISLDKPCKFHECENIYAVCMKRDCLINNSRLVCRRCLITNHSSHGEFIILFEDLN